MNQPTSSAAGFSVDLERAPDAIRDLEDAKAQLESIRDDALLLGDVRPPANDQVSVDAAATLSAVAASGPGSLFAAVEAGLRHLQGLIDGLREELDTYHRSEATTRSNVTSVDRG